MRVRIIKKTTLKGNKYTIEDNENIKGQSSFFGGKLVVFDESGETLGLRQPNWFLKAINSLPIFNIFRFTPYIYEKNNQKCGKAKSLFFKPAFILHVKDDVYEIRGHSNDYYSIMKNDEQVALCNKRHLTYCGESNYFLEFNDNVSDKLMLLFLFVILIDTVFHTQRNRFDMVRFETSIVPRDRFSNRTKWKP